MAHRHFDQSGVICLAPHGNKVIVKSQLSLKREFVESLQVVKCECRPWVRNRRWVPLHPKKLSALDDLAFAPAEVDADFVET